MTGIHRNLRRRIADVILDAAGDAIIACEANGIIRCENLGTSRIFGLGNSRPIARHHEFGPASNPAPGGFSQNGRSWTKPLFRRSPSCRCLHALRTDRQSRSNSRPLRLSTLVEL